MSDMNYYRLNDHVLFRMVLVKFFYFNCDNIGLFQLIFNQML